MTGRLGRDGSSEWAPLRLGPDVVQRLLPHRRPFLFVDAVDAIALGPRPSLRARRMISVNEAVFEGHFPGLALWPGVYTIEGMGQASNLLLVVLGLIDGFAEQGTSDREVFEALRGIDARARFGTRAETATERALIDGLGTPRMRMGFAGAVDVKLIEPVFAGSVLEYRVTLGHVLANARRFEVEAWVDDRPVARGTLGSAAP